MQSSNNKGLTFGTHLSCKIIKTFLQSIFIVRGLISCYMDSVCIVLDSCICLFLSMCRCMLIYIALNLFHILENTIVTNVRAFCFCTIATMISMK